MSDGYRDDGTGTEDWGVTRITEQVAAWPSVPSSTLDNQQFYRRMSAAYSQRLRTTAEALCDCYRELNEIHARDGLPYTSEGIKAGVSQEWFTAVVENARAVLAQLEKEGLT